MGQILTRDQLITKWTDVLLPTNGAKAIQALALRTALEDFLDSSRSYASVLAQDDEIENISITAASTQLELNSNRISANELLEGDESSGNWAVRVKSPAFYFCTVRFQGRWNAGEDLNLEIFVNGAVNPITPILIRNEGQGGNDPVTLSVSRLGFIINSGMIAAGPGGNYAEVTLNARSTTGNFLLDQEASELALEYNNYSIGTVG